MILLGFSQGACLALEWNARPPQRYGGVAGFTVKQSMGVEVTLRLYPGMGHTINLDELEFLREMMGKVYKRRLTDDEGQRVFLRLLF